MKKIATILLVMIVIFIMNTQTCFATSTSTNIDTDAMLEQQFDFADLDQLDPYIPQDAKDIMDEKQLTPKTMSKFSMKDVWDTVVDLVKKQFTKPLNLFLYLAAIIIICAFVDNLKNSFADKNINSVFRMVATLCICMSVISPIIECIQRTIKAITECANFMLSFIPIWSGVIIASGQVATASTYNVVLFVACQVIAQISSKILLPLLGIYLALSVVSSITDTIRIDGFLTSIKNVVCWGLGISLTVFIGLLSMQTLVSAGVDGLGSKTAKFLIGNLIPVFGSALSDAFFAAQGCMKLLKTTIGIFGIGVAIFSFLPLLIQTVLWYITVNLSGLIADLFENKAISGLLKTIGATLSILISVILCFVILVIISITIVLISGMGL